MTYSVKEIFYSLQGEGAHTGRPAVFCRFTGCNLWSGREEDRNDAVCSFCDTECVGIDGIAGGKFDNAGSLAEAVRTLWPNETSSRVRPYVICTGGEPLLQLDTALLDALHLQGFEVAVETNGTLAAPVGLDWICVSPKAGSELVLTQGDELKLVYPQNELRPYQFEELKFRHFYLQPMDGPELQQNTQKTIDYCLRNPRWRLSLQTHKIVGIP